MEKEVKETRKVKTGVGGGDREKGHKEDEASMKKKKQKEDD